MTLSLAVVYTRNGILLSSNANYSPFRSWLFVNVFSDSSVAIKNNVNLSTWFIWKLSSPTWAYKRTEFINVNYKFIRTMKPIFYISNHHNWISSKMKLIIFWLLSWFTQNGGISLEAHKTIWFTRYCNLTKKYNKNYDTTQLRSKTEERSVWLWKQHCLEYLLNS